MLKRIAAVFFVLVLAGQVLAGVCMCFDEMGSGHSKMSCCKRKKSGTASISKKPCCDSACGEPTSDTVPRSKAESSIKIPLAVRSAVEKLIVSLNWRAKSGMLPTVPKRFREALPQKSNARDLYLTNHAFLI